MGDGWTTEIWNTYVNASGQFNHRVTCSGGISLLSERSSDVTLHALGLGCHNPRLPSHGCVRWVLATA
jgi:hypothetical protein